MSCTDVLLRVFKKDFRNLVAMCETLRQEVEKRLDIVPLLQPTHNH